MSGASMGPVPSVSTYNRYCGNPKPTQPPFVSVAVTVTVSPFFNVVAEAESATEAVSVWQAIVGVGLATRGVLEVSTSVTAPVAVLVGLVMGVTTVVTLAPGSTTTKGVAVGVIAGATAHPIRNKSKGGTVSKYWRNTITTHRGVVTASIYYHSIVARNCCQGISG